MEKKKNGAGSIAALVIGIILLAVTIIIQGMVSKKTGMANAQAAQMFAEATKGGTLPSAGILGNMNGIIAQFQVMVMVAMTILASKKGYIASVVLALLNIGSTLMSFMQSASKNSVIGMVVSVISIVIITIIYVYSVKITKAHDELVASNQHLIETNKVIREKDEKLTYLAYYDVLTGLGNRMLFIDHMNEMIEQEKDEPFSVVFFGIDDFKKINDSYGHNAGDAMLSTYSDRLRLFCGKTNFVGRLGGDEFAVILKGNMTESNIVNYIENLRAAVCEPVQVNNAVLQATMSFGVASYPVDGLTSEEILKSTDIAVLNAKANGKDRTCFYSQQQYIQKNI